MMRLVDRGVEGARANPSQVQVAVRCTDLGEARISGRAKVRMATLGEGDGDGSDAQEDEREGVERAEADGTEEGSADSSRRGLVGDLVPGEGRQAGRTGRNEALGGALGAAGSARQGRRVIVVFTVGVGFFFFLGKTENALKIALEGRPVVGCICGPWHHRKVSVGCRRATDEVGTTTRMETPSC